MRLRICVTHHWIDAHQSFASRIVPAVECIDNVRTCLGLLIGGHGVLQIHAAAHTRTQDGWMARRADNSDVNARAISLRCAPYPTGPCTCVVSLRIASPPLTRCRLGWWWPSAAFLDWIPACRAARGAGGRSAWRPVRLHSGQKRRPLHDWWKDRDAASTTPANARTNASLRSDREGLGAECVWELGMSGTVCSEYQIISRYKKLIVCQICLAPINQQDRVRGIVAARRIVSMRLHVHRARVLRQSAACGHKADRT